MEHNVALEMRSYGGLGSKQVNYETVVLSLSKD